MGRSDQILIASLGGALTAIVLVAFRDRITPGSLAEWAGAVATTAAVVVALAVAGSAQRSEAEQREARARVAAFRLSPSLVMILGQASRARAALQRLSEGVGPAVRNLEMVIEQLQIPTSIPPEVFADTWLLPPPIALAVAQLDSRLLAHAQMFRVFATTDAIAMALQRVNLAPALEESLGSIERLATTVMKYTAEVSDEVVRRDRAARS